MHAEREQQRRARPHRIGGDLERRVAGEQRLLDDEERRLCDRGGEHHERPGGEREPAALAQRDHERADAALARSATELSGRIRLASFPTATRALLAGKLAALRARHPQLRVDLSELEPHESLPALALGRIDVAVAHEYDLIARDAARDLRRAELLREPVLLAEPKGSRPLTTVRLADYAERDWVVPPAATACGELVRRACRTAGFEPRVVAETGDFSVACSLAAAGVGVALVPRLGVVACDDLVVRSLQPALERRIFVAARSGSDDHPLIRAVVDAIV